MQICFGIITVSMPPSTSGSYRTAPQSTVAHAVGNQRRRPCHAMPWNDLMVVGGNLHQVSARRMGKSAFQKRTIRNLHYTGSLALSANTSRMRSFIGCPRPEKSSANRKSDAESYGSGSFVVTTAFPRRASCTPAARRSARYLLATQARCDRGSGQVGTPAGRHTAQRTHEMPASQVTTHRRRC